VVVVVGFGSGLDYPRLNCSVINNNLVGAPEMTNENLDEIGKTFREYFNHNNKTCSNCMHFSDLDESCMNENKSIDSVPAGRAHQLSCDEWSEMNANDFMAGQRHCRDGIAHKSGMSESYDRGYSAQYSWEQVRSARHFK
jgi:hypothetical protein